MDWGVGKLVNWQSGQLVDETTSTSRNKPSDKCFGGIMAFSLLRTFTPGSEIRDGSISLELSLH